MGLLSWLFPSDADRVERARALMADGRHEQARKLLVNNAHPEAEALYDACSAVVDEADRATRKKALVADGFRGWKVEITTDKERHRKELEALVTQELRKAGIDLSEVEVDPEGFKAAARRAQRRATRSRGAAATIQLVPVVAVDEKRR